MSQPSEDWTEDEGVEEIPQTPLDYAEDDDLVSQWRLAQSDDPVDPEVEGTEGLEE